MHNAIVDILCDLKENYNAVGIKAEFETEEISLKEILCLKEFVCKSGLDFTIKIGGASSTKDLFEAKSIGVNNIVAPMVESAYGAKKYFETIQKVFSEDEIKNLGIFINIETKQGLECLEEILNHNESEILTGIVLGRSDMAQSIGEDCSFVNSDKMLEIATIIANLTSKSNKELIIGGAVSTLSLPFFRKIPYNILSKFETRKVIFNAQEVLNSNNSENAVNNALKFELLWLKYKQQFFDNTPIDINKRIKILESRLKIYSLTGGTIK